MKNNMAVSKGGKATNSHNFVVVACMHSELAAA